jgi:hypothetical protein
MVSSQRSSLEPLSPPQEFETWAGYRRSLATLSPDQLISLLTTINGQLQEDRIRRMESILSSSQSLEGALDRPVLSSTRLATQHSPMDRGVPPSTFQQPSAVDLLSASQRLGPKLAQRLMLASARATSRREVE